MRNNRRQFLGSLARGLLLPIGGGAVALAEPAKAAALQITQGPLPLSVDAMRLRSLKRDLRRCCESQDDYPSLSAYGDAWREITYEISPLEKRIQQRPATSWTDVNWQRWHTGASSIAVLTATPTTQRLHLPRLY